MYKILFVLVCISTVSLIEFGVLHNREVALNRAGQLLHYGDRALFDFYKNDDLNVMTI